MTANLNIQVNVIYTDKIYKSLHLTLELTKIQGFVDLSLSTGYSTVQAEIMK